jgi:hypothetical protein
MFQGLRLLESSTGHVMVTKMKDQYRFTKKKKKTSCSFRPIKLTAHYICAYSSLIDILFKVPTQNIPIYYNYFLSFMKDKSMHYIRMAKMKFHCEQ